MIKTNISNKNFWENEVDGYCFLLGENFELTPEMKQLESECYPNLKEILNKHKFQGKLGQTFTLSCLRNDKVITNIFVGRGKLDSQWDTLFENLRRAIGSMVNQLKALSIKESVVALPSSEHLGVDSFELLKQACITAHMADYEFTTFKSNKKDDFEGILHFISDGAKEAITEGDIIGKAINLSRHWIDLPPNVLTPTKLSEEAKKMADKVGLKYEVFGREKALSLGMGGFCAVDSGSDQDGKFIILEHKVSNNAPTIALVGKGVTFDTGGVSLKPAASMTGMKYDMSGASVAIGAINAIAQLKPNVNVVAITPAVENMPSGKSSKQDDIITFMNGKSAEIVNTDAEGRLILADALCYAEKNYQPDVIIDLATLTGACVVALGHAYTALMTRDDALASRLIKEGVLTGDRLWRLPFHDDYKPANNSKVADISNCGSREYGAGTITAGLFLENFVEKTPWAHLDIAGTADGVPNISYFGKGATGTCIRLLVEFTKNFAK